MTMRRAVAATMAGAAALAMAGAAPVQASATTRGPAAAAPQSDTPRKPRPAPRQAPIWPERGAPAPAVPVLRWKKCEDAKNPRLRCATALVPLDYRDPRGPRIPVDVAKLPARGKRAGSVFVNPGGPGIPATSRITRHAEVLGKAVTDRYDVVAVDPRGVGESSVARCWSTRPEPSSDDDYPTTPKQARQRIAYNEYERRACAATGRPIVDHMTTGETARDMDLVRAAVGDRSLTFYGVSYGTLLGQTYAALFPSRVRAIVIDGVVDPIEATTSHGRRAQRAPMSTRMASGLAADTSLRAAFRACDAAGPKRCPQAGRIAKEWGALHARLLRGDVTVNGETYTRASVMTTLVQQMYDPADYPQALAFVDDTYRAVVLGKKPVNPAPAPRAGVAPAGAWGVGAPVTAAGRVGPVVPSTKPQPDAARWWNTFRQEGVMCADSVNPKDPAVWAKVARDSTRTSWFTEAWTWHSSLCAGWPGRSTGAYRGPWTVKPANPLLVIGNTYDPATGLPAAKTAARLSPGARLVTVDSFGHTGAPYSSCARAHVTRYVLTGRLPAKDTTCRADKPLF